MTNNDIKELAKVIAPNINAAPKYSDKLTIKKKDLDGKEGEIVVLKT